MDDHPPDQLNVISIAGTQLRTLQSRSQPRLPAQAQAMLDPVSADAAVALVSSCLALVRLAGMTDREVKDWLHVAVGEVRHYPADILIDACREVRRTVTHHSRIVPTIVRFADDRLAVRRRAAELRETGVQQALQLVQERWTPTKAELDAIKAKARAEAAGNSGGAA